MNLLGRDVPVPIRRLLRSSLKVMIQPVTIRLRWPLSRTSGRERLFGPNVAGSFAPFNRWQAPGTSALNLIGWSVVERVKTTPDM